MIQLLLENPLLLLVVVAALGYVLGQIRIKGSSLGVAAVLFAGLGVGALHPDLKLPEFVTLLGLLAGKLAGLQTQPAVLSYALEQSGNELPNIGYATVFPVATITKILFAQLILVFLG